jgi:hypothetical protein
MKIEKIEKSRIFKILVAGTIFFFFRILDTFFVVPATKILKNLLFQFSFSHSNSD